MSLTIDFGIQKIFLEKFIFGIKIVIILVFWKKSGGYECVRSV